jgi:hypothetical protein
MSAWSAVAKFMVTTSGLGHAIDDLLMKGIDT